MEWFTNLTQYDKEGIIRDYLPLMKTSWTLNIDHSLENFTFIIVFVKMVTTWFFVGKNYTSIS